MDFLNNKHYAVVFSARAVLRHGRLTTHRRDAIHIRELVSCTHYRVLYPYNINFFAPLSVHIALALWFGNSGLNCLIFSLFIRGINGGDTVIIIPIVIQMVTRCFEWVRVYVRFENLQSIDRLKGNSSNKKA